MSNDMPRPAEGAHLRTVALPRDANASGDIFGGWTLSQMDLAGGTFAAARSSKRAVTVRIDAVEFLKPVSVGDDVSVFCNLKHEGNTSIAIRIEVWARVRTGDAPHKVQTLRLEDTVDTVTIEVRQEMAEHESQVIQRETRSASYRADDRALLLGGTPWQPLWPA